MYSDDEVSRLILLNRLVQAGHAISQLARLSDSELGALLERSKTLQEPSLKRRGPLECERIRLALDALDRFDPRRFEIELRTIQAQIPVHEFLLKVAAFVYARLELLLEKGVLRKEERLVLSSIVRESLFRSMSRVDTSGPLPTSSPRFILAAVRQDACDLPLLIMALLCRLNGTHSWYLGPGVSARELSYVARCGCAQRVFLAHGYGESPAEFRDYLVQLNEGLSKGSEVWVLSPGGHRFDFSDNAFGLREFSDFAALDPELRALSLLPPVQEMSKLK